MKLVIEHYGKFMLEAIVVIAVTGIIFLGLTDANGNMGIFAVTGAHLEVEAENYLNYTDFKNVYKTESEKSAPHITWYGGRIVAGTHALSDYIKATDYAGNNLGFLVQSITAPDGSDCLSSYNQDTTEISLLQMGVYTVTVSAEDDGKRTTKATVQIPVNSN